MSSDPPVLPTRRRALQVLAAGGLAAGAGLRDVLAQGVAPAVVTPDGVRPQLLHGVMSGDVTDRRAIVWSRADRAARMIVDVATTESMADARRVVGPAALEASDFTARVDLGGLAPGQTHFYRVQFQDLADPKVYSVPLIGRFRTPHDKPRDLVFAFRATRPDRAGASTRPGAATASTNRCASSIPTSSSTRETRSTPTARSRPR
jgi:alkaline phosphatase D